jgi:orotate phosphoribosyltransferase
MLEDTPGAEGTVALMEASGALLAGHFALSSGLHSDRYIQCALLLQEPARAEVVGRSLGGLVEKALGRGVVDVVASPALGGIIIGHEVARALGTRCVFVERRAGEMMLRRGFAVSPGEKVLVVEDVVTTGLSTGEVIKVVADMGGTVVGLAAIVNRSAGTASDLPFACLVRAEIVNYQPAECPMCKKGIPLSKPGSRPGK